MEDDRLPYRATRGGAAYDGITRLPASVLLADVRSAYNVGAFFRTAEAVRCEHLYLAGISPPPTHRGVAKTALGAEQRVAWSVATDPLGVLRGFAEHVDRYAGTDRAPVVRDR